MISIKKLIEKDGRWYGGIEPKLLKPLKVVWSQWNEVLKCFVLIKK